MVDALPFRLLPLLYGFDGEMGKVRVSIVACPDDLDSSVPLVCVHGRCRVRKDSSTDLVDI